MELINFTLTEHMVESKIEQATQDALKTTIQKLQDEINDKTKELRKYVDM